MEIQLVLNDLSFAHLATDEAHARSGMEAFLRVIGRAVRCGVARILRVPHGFQGQMLSAGYPLVKWQNDFQVDREQRRYFNSIVSKVSYLDGLPTIEDQLTLVEYTHQGVPAKGLGVAAALDGLAVSVNFTELWNSPNVLVQRTWIDLDGDGEMLSSDEQVRNATSLGHVDSHAHWIRDRCQSGARDGAEIWRCRNQLLPALEFCARVETDLQHLGATDVMLKPVYERLKELDNYAREWTTGPFDPSQLPSKLTPESETAIKQHGDELTFRCPDGKNRLFSWHARLTPGAWRLHFYPNGTNRRIIIGRIGRKLFI